MSAENIKIFNANPWKMHISDCAIRAVTMATGMRYELVCKKFGVSWKRGRGLIRDTGIQLEDVKRVFDEYFGAVTDFNEEMPQDLVDDPKFDEVRQTDRELGVAEDASGITLAEFLDLYAGEGQFLVGLVGNPSAQNANVRDPDEGHIVCARCLPGRPGFAIDTFDSSEMIVDSFMQVVKTVPRSSPEHWVWDKQNRCFAGYGMEKPAG